VFVVALAASVVVAVAASSSVFLQLIAAVVVLLLFFEGASRAVWLMHTTVSVRAVARRARETWRPRKSLVPRSLPPVPELLVGRANELDSLREYLRGLPQNHPPATVVIHGEAGIGRTTLALRLAHEIADRYPDGQIYANLECTDVDAPDAPHSALSNGLAVLVKALDTPWGLLPPSFADRVNTYRRLAEDKQLLVVLDDARDEKELRDLVPMGPGSLAIITSTRPITNIPGAKEFEVRPLTEPDALELLANIVGEQEIERRAAQELVRGCDYHPLAIRLIGTALTSYSGAEVTVEVERLITARRGADAPLGGILDGAYSTLTSDEQTALRCLGSMNKTVFAPWMFVAASGKPPHDCNVLVDRLTRAQLLTKMSGSSRRSALYRLSTAVLEYAKDRAAREDTAVVHERRERLRSAFQGRRHRSSQLLRALRLAESGDLAEAIRTVREEMFLAGDRDDDVTEARSNAVLADLYTELGYLTDAREAIDLALRSDDQLIRASAYRVSGRIAYRQRRLTDAKTALDTALRHAVAIDATVEVAWIHGERAIGLARAGEHGDAADDADRAMDISESLDPLSRFRAYYARATVHFYLGEPEEAARLFTDARELLGDEHRLRRAWLLQARARIELAGERPDAAAEVATEGLDLFTHMRHRYGVAMCRSELGRAFVVREQDDAAIDEFREALTIFRDCGGDWLEGRISLELAACHRRRGQHDRAAQLEAKAAEIFATLGDGERAVQAARGLAFFPLRRHSRGQLDSVNY
jgi:tetratricopeptide (TPR) repeat protein